jgi:SAM-dependent methyltransferase
MEKVNMQNKAAYPLETQNWFSSESRFDQLYPDSIRELGRRHWTPLTVSRKAAAFLTSEPRAKILDIGSGVGKFCLAAAHYNCLGQFTGVEQRKSLVYKAETARQVLRLSNVKFIHGNFTQLNFRDYDHFYFYNAFYENLVGTDKIDNSIMYSRELYNYYNRYLFRQLELKPVGTRLATYHSLEDEIPPNYLMVGTEMDNDLKFWVKI